MGLRFDLSSTSIVAYLTSPGGQETPRITLGQLLEFLRSLAEDADYARPRVISSNPAWIADIKRTAQNSLNLIHEKSAELQYDEMVALPCFQVSVSSLCVGRIGA